MSNITPSKKGGTSVDPSDLLAQKKRNIYLAIAKQNVVKGGSVQLANRQIGYDNGFTELRSKRGLDLYLSNSSVSGSSPGIPSPTGVVRRPGMYPQYNEILWATPRTGTLNFYFVQGPTITLTNRMLVYAAVDASLGIITNYPSNFDGLQYTVAVVNVVNGVESPLNDVSNTNTFFNRLQQ